MILVFLLFGVIEPETATLSFPNTILAYLLVLIDLVIDGYQDLKQG